MPDDFELSPDANKKLQEYSEVTQSKILDHLYALANDPIGLGSPPHAPYPPDFDIYKFESDDGGDEFDLVAIFEPFRGEEMLRIFDIVDNVRGMMV